ncbi:hypothetical protein [Streptomyces sp. NPDC048277]|uniref:hypothetical protein n=1 Tax=Streptomyces sp. NPDC048277 TaxID=3155027 RepID=UPI00340266A2
MTVDGPGMRSEQFGEGFRIAGAYPVTQGKFHNQPCPLGTGHLCGDDHTTRGRFPGGHGVGDASAVVGGAFGAARNSGL